MPILNNRLIGEINSLGDLDRKELLGLWNTAFGAPPFKDARKEHAYSRCSLSHTMQIDGRFKAIRQPCSAQNC